MLCSIPHATSPPVSHTLSVSPTNVATSPIKESPLAEPEFTSTVDDPEPVSDETFESEVLQSKEPVLVDFWAEWCGPCKMIGPSLEEISKELDGKVKIAKLNIDENPELAAQFGVRSIPTLMMFKAGEVADMKVGALPKTALSQWINSSAA